MSTAIPPNIRLRYWFHSLLFAWLSAMFPITSAAQENAGADPDAVYLKSFADPFVADGFDSPLADIKSRKSSGTVRTIGNGKVVYSRQDTPAGAATVVIKHQFLENGKLTTVFSLYSPLNHLQVAAGQNVKREAKLGSVAKGPENTPAQLRFEIRDSNPDLDSTPLAPFTNEQAAANRQAATRFIDSHRKLLHPATTPDLLLAVKHRYQLYRFQNGAVTKTYEIALSQKPTGHKFVEGDLHLPEGEYRIIQKAKGPFIGRSWMKYLGVAWLRIDYPNTADAAAALAENRITQTVHDAIVRAHRAGKMPPQDSPLGGGIGVHGWKEPGWNPEASRDITWGCISLNKDELLRLAADTKVGTPIIIVP